MSGAEREGRRITRELAIEPRRIARPGRRRERAAGPAAAEGTEQRGDAVTDMFPERFVEGVQPFSAVLLTQRVHLVQKIRMSADRALPEYDEIAGQDIGALHRDADRHRAIEGAHVVLRSVDHGLAAMDVHGIVDGDPHPLGRLQLHDAGDDRGMMALVERGAGQPPRGVEQIGGPGDPGQRALDAFELADRHVELLADPGVGAGGARGKGRARGRQ